MRARMIALATEMEAEWLRQGRDPETVGGSRIAVARQVLETPDEPWQAVRDEVRGLLELKPPPPEGET